MRGRVRNVVTIAMLVASMGWRQAGAQFDPAEMTRQMANSRIMLGQAYLGNGRYTDAAAEFETVVLDIDDPDHEISDLKATAGVFLCLARAKAKQLDAARQACNRVIQTPDAPQDMKRQATILLGKLN